MDKLLKQVKDLITQVEINNYQDEEGYELKHNIKYIELKEVYEECVMNKGISEDKDLGLTMSLNIDIEQFEKDMDKINEIVNTTADEIDKLNKAAIKLATESTMNIDEAIGRISTKVVISTYGGEESKDIDIMGNVEDVLRVIDHIL